MIISHKHKFIFLKTRKTAGTSIEIALSKVCEKDDIITPISQKDELNRKELGFLGPQNYKIPFRNYTKLDWYRFLRYRKRALFYNHMTALEIRNYIGSEKWDGYYKFAFDRNPYDKVVSLYYWYGGDEKYGNFKNFINTGDFNNLKSFELYSIKGKVILDDIFKYEELTLSIKKINKRLGLQNDEIMLPLKKAKGSFRNTKDYKDLFDDETRSIIEISMAREIKTMNYIF